jgi:hypothetical protein
MNRSFFRLLATFRTRFSACNTLSRFCARRVLCRPAFPSAPALRSTNSVADCSALFVGFFATMAGSDSSRPFIIGCGSSPSRCGPLRASPAGQTRGLPVPAQGPSAHARVFDHAGPLGHSRWRARPCCLPPSERRRRPEMTSFAAQWLACTLPYRRFATALADCVARLGADAVRYPFIAMDSHHLVLAGLPAHSD